MTNAEILRAVSHGLELNSLMINYHIILSAVSQTCMGNSNVTKADLILLLYDGKILLPYDG